MHKLMQKYNNLSRPIFDKCCYSIIIIIFRRENSINYGSLAQLQFQRYIYLFCDVRPMLKFLLSVVNELLPAVLTGSHWNQT